MKKPVLVIMAAGMGSRYGGLKQIDSVDRTGHIIMDFSIYDAKKAGFEDVVIIIKKENQQAFHEAIGDRISKSVNVSYVYQDLKDIPDGFAIPENRVKPFGTGHAVLACRKLVNGPFAVINADDYYGSQGFKQIYDFLSTSHESHTYGMVSYLLKNTITENGYVSRGICRVSPQGELLGIDERTHIEKRGDSIEYTEDGTTWVPLKDETPVSMNLWGFSAEFMKELQNRFTEFLTTTLVSNPLKGEYFLPFVVDDLLRENKVKVKVLPSQDKWYGVTYHEDKEKVTAALSKMEDEGLYNFK